MRSPQDGAQNGPTHGGRDENRVRRGHEGGVGEMRTRAVSEKGCKRQATKSGGAERPRREEGRGRSDNKRNQAAGLATGEALNTARPRNTRPRVRTPR